MRHVTHPGGKELAYGLQLWTQRLAMRASIDDEDREKLLRLPGRRIDVRTNVDFVRLGEITDHACLIVDGIAGRFAQTAAGARLITAVHLPGDMIDLHSTVVPKASSALQALSRSVVIQIPHEAIRALTEESPMLARAFWRDCVIDGTILSEWALNVARRPARGRLAHLICEMAIRYACIGHEIRDVTFPMTQQHIGDMTALTAVHVNRMFRSLIDDGLIDTQFGKVQILDWAGLVRAADFDAAYLHIPEPKLQAVVATA